MKQGRDFIDEAYIKSSKAILISGTALAESPSREAAIKAVLLAKEADIIMVSRDEFDLTEKLIQPKLTDEESAALWQSYNAKIVVIKLGGIGETGTYASNIIFKYLEDNCE